MDKDYRDLIVNTHQAKTAVTKLFDNVNKKYMENGDTDLLPVTRAIASQLTTVLQSIGDDLERLSFVRMVDRHCCVCGKDYQTPYNPKGLYINACYECYEYRNG